MEIAPDRNPDLLVSVSDPLRHTDPIKDYVSYTLATRTTMPSFSSTDLAVRRRYKDFLEFRQQLVQLYPSLVVPPLPEKMTTKYLDRFSDTFLEKRRRALEQFMTRLSVHPQLSQSEHLRHFLSEENWVKQDDEKLSNSAWMKMSLSNRGKSKNDPEGNSFENLKNYFIEFHKTLSSIHGLLRSVSQKHFELAENYNSLGESFLLLSDQPESTLEAAIRTLGQVFAQKQSALLSEAANQLDFNTVESIKEYVLIGQAALTVLKYRDAPLNTYLSALSDLTETKAELLRLQKQQEDPSPKRSSFSSLLGLSDDPQLKINRLQERLQTEEVKLSTSRDTLESVSRALISEMERLHQYKLKDLRHMLIEFVTGQIDLHKKSADNWETTLTTISNISLMELANASRNQDRDEGFNFAPTSSANQKKETTEQGSRFSSPPSTNTAQSKETFNNYNSTGDSQNTHDFFSSSSSSSSHQTAPSTVSDPFTSPFTSPFSEPSSSDPFSDPFADPSPSIVPPSSSQPSSSSSPFAPYDDEIPTEPTNPGPEDSQ